MTVMGFRLIGKREERKGGRLSGVAWPSGLSAGQAI